MSATPYAANRALAYCSRMLSLAATDWELREDNPCIGVKRFPEHARERFFTDDELAEIGAALSTAEAEGLEVPDFILFVRLLATTGMRLGEALALTWPNVDLPGRAIRSRRESEGWRSDSTSRILDGRRQPSFGGTSRMTRECQVRMCVQ
jgi:integrase